MFRLPVSGIASAFVLSAGLSGATSTLLHAADLSQTPPIERARYLMGTVCEAVVYPVGDVDRAAVADAIEAAFDEIARLEAVLSDWRVDSELSRLNREAASVPFLCSEDLFDFIQAAVEYNRLTAGAFEAAVAPLVKVWDLRGEGRIPEPEEIADALGAARTSRLVLEPSERSVRFEVPGMGLDPGGLGKGFAMDAALMVLKERGVRSALLDFGGQVTVMGSPPGTDNWEVAIAHPVERDQPFLTVALSEGSIATSGNSEKKLTLDGRQLGHILDPRTGTPLETGGSVSVIARTGTDADAFSTAMLVMGSEKGLAWAAGRPDLSAVYLNITDAGEVQVRATPGLDITRLPVAGSGLHPPLERVDDDADATDRSDAGSCTSCCAHGTGLGGTGRGGEDVGRSSRGARAKDRRAGGGPEGGDRLRDNNGCCRAATAD